MPYDKILIGKIRNIDYTKGVGEIVTSNNVYMFLIEDVYSDNLLPDEYVRFRSEKIQDTNRAFFVYRIDKEFTNNKDYISKTKKVVTRGE